jgi:hypothetical protein
VYAEVAEQVLEILDASKRVTDTRKVDFQLAE